MNVARIYLGSSRAAVLPGEGIENKLEHCKVGKVKHSAAVYGREIENELCKGRG